MRVLGVVLAGLALLLLCTGFGATTTLRAPEGFTVQVPVTLTPEKPEKGFTHDGYPYASILYTGGDYLIEVADYSFLPDGTITDASGITAYSASDLAQPLDGTTVFYDALWNIPLNQNTVELVTFGTDTHLETAPGWDDVTGVGVPKPKAFADFFKP
jgi:hypothetical protein